MNVAGGYQILDFSGFVIRDGSSYNVPGIYDTVMNTSKPIVIHGLSDSSNNKYSDFYCQLIRGPYNCSCAMIIASLSINSCDIYTIDINSNDTVSFRKSTIKEV